MKALFVSKQKNRNIFGKAGQLTLHLTSLQLSATVLPGGWFEPFLSGPRNILQFVTLCNTGRRPERRAIGECSPGKERFVIVNGNEERDGYPTRRG